MIGVALRDQLIQAQLLTWDPSVHGPSRADATREVDQALTGMDSADLAARLMALAPAGHPAWHPKSLMNRLTPSGRDRELLSGIRFMGGDPGRPFVDLLATSAPWEHPDELADDARALLEQWRAWTPTRVRVPQHFGSKDAGPQAQYPVDQALLVAEMATVPRLDLPPGVTATRTPLTEQLWTWYEGELRAVMAGAFADCTRAESRTALASTASTGHLVSLLRGDAVLALIALPRAERSGLRGHRIQELLVAQQHRGQGLAKIITCHAAQMVLRPEAPWLMGMIDGRNHPAFRSARSVGRRPLRAWHWVTPDLPQ